jgi:hypothetical protein
LLFLLNSSIFAQKSCLNTLREAKTLYEQGLIDEIPELLAGCMESGFTRAQRIEAYKLIILAYLFDDDQFAAEKTMDEFLRKFPEYEIMPNDPVEFVYLLESYKTSSYYSLNLTFGPTFSNRRVTENYSAMNLSRTDFLDKTGTGFQVGFGISRNLFKSVNGNIGVFYTVNNYTYSEECISLLDSLTLSFADLLVNEQLTMINFPLSLSYRFGRGNLNYVFRLGGTAGLVRKAYLTPTRSQPTIESISESVDIADHRNSMYYAAIVGTGLEYKIPRGFLVLDIRYQIGFQNMTIGDRFSTPRLNGRYLHIDDDFKLDYVSVCLGYHFSIYQSKKNRF